MFYLNKSESIAELAKALSKFQGEVKQPMKDKDNPFFKSKYVPLENVVEAITETAPKHGLSFLQYPINNDNKVGIVTILMHESGEWIETDPIFTTPPKQDAQATGSVITYLKRYSLSAVFGITSDEDDDGNAASNPQQSTKQSNGASDKQLGLVQSLVKKKPKEEQATVFNTMIQQLQLSRVMTEWTSQQASAAIKYLQGQ